MQILNGIKKLAVLFVLALPLLISQAQADEAPLQLYEDKIKAALIYDFLKYTNWSADILAKSHNSIQLCLLGDDSFDDYLYLLKGRKVQQFSIAILPAKDIAETKNCSIIFVHRNQEDIVPQLLQQLSGKQILTVSDINRFAAEGGMVEIHKQNDHIEFFINKKALDHSGLSIQSRLLKLARPMT